MKENFAKASLYAIPLFLAPFVDKLADLLLNDQWPSPPKLVGCACLALCRPASDYALTLMAAMNGASRRPSHDNERPTPAIRRPVADVAAYFHQP